MRTRVTRVLTPVVVGLAAIVLWLLLTLPPNPRPVDLADWTGTSAATVTGAFHIHTTRSDGGASPDDVARAAQRAGLQFLIFTDHGDGTRTPDPPQYRAGVLTLDGVEISTTGGHYIAVGLPAAPYRLGGGPDAVVEDVRRLGGFGVVAHPTSAKPDLGWDDLALDVDGIEWLNADSQWRDESLPRLLPAAARYLVRPQAVLASLLDRPEGALALWDVSASRRAVVGLAGSDAHGRVGQATTLEGDTGLWRAGLPDYEQVFRTFSLHAQLKQPWTTDPQRDAGLLLDALRGGRVSTVIDGIAGPAALRFAAITPARTYAMGESVPPGAELRVSVALPDGGTIVLLADGQPVAESDSAELRHRSRGPAVYRVEVQVGDAPGSPPIPWIVSNPIYVGAPPARTRTRVPRIPVASEGLIESEEEHDGTVWVVEHDVSSTATVQSGSGELTFRYQLGPETASSQYAAAVRALHVDALDPFDGVGFDVVASQPVRLMVQLRAGGGPEEQRWRKSFYADTTPRRVTVALDEMEPVADRVPVGSGEAGRNSSDALLFVVDMVNSVPGSAGEIVLSDLTLERW